MPKLDDPWAKVCLPLKEYEESLSPSLSFNKNQLMLTLVSPLPLHPPDSLKQTLTNKFFFYLDS
jgi:hypothetical protein